MAENRISRRNTLLGAAAASSAGVSALAASAASAADSNRSVPESRLQWLVDRAEIEDLIKRLTFALDDRDWTAAASCFVTDTEIKVGGVPIRGADAFIAAAATAVSDITNTQHAPMTILVELEGRDRAKVRTQLLGVHDVTPPDGLARILTGQRYHYRVVRQQGSWRISAIDNQTVWLEGDPEGRAAAKGRRRT
jgi:hypothetical protein